MNSRKIFDEKIAPALQYVGTIGAVIMTFAYIIIVVIMVYGFEFRQSPSQTIIFASVNALWGFVIMQFMKLQGNSFAANIEENKAITDRYYNTKTKDKKLHSMAYYWVTSCLKDFVTKAISAGISTFALVYIVIKGSQDYTMFLLAGANLAMFISFGLLAMNKAFCFYNEYHIPYIKEKLREAEEKNDNN